MTSTTGLVFTREFQPRVCGLTKGIPDTTHVVTYTCIFLRKITSVRCLKLLTEQARNQLNPCLHRGCGSEYAGVPVTQVWSHVPGNPST